MKKLLTIALILCTVTGFAQMRGGAQYDPGAARKNLSNVDSAATPSMTSITLSDKVKAAWADILGDIYASGTARVGAGTAAAPAYTFSSDPDTGIYSPGANALGFGVNGAENARIIDNYFIFGADSITPFLGNTNKSILLYSTSDASFQVSGSGAWYEAISSNATTYGGLRIYDKDKVFQAGMFCAGDNDLQILASATERIRITSGGNVLIGTTTDDGANKLQVNGSVKFDVGSSIWAVKEITLADDDAVNLRTLFGAANFMKGTIKAVSVDFGPAGDALILGASDVVVIGVNYTQFVNTDTDGNLCLFPEPGATHDYILKNRLGGSSTIIVVYQGIQ